MINFRKNTLALTVCCMTLVACSSDKTDVGLTKTVAVTLKSALGAKRAGPVPVTNTTAADVAKFNTPVLQANPQSLGGSNFLALVARRNDSRGGTVEVWQSADNAQVFLNKGVLVGTRGVGTDVLASDAAQTIDAVTNTRNGRGTRQYELGDGDGTSTYITLSCTWENLGASQISIAGQSLATTHMKETCQTANDERTRIENHYWVQPNGQIKKSVQWAGRAVGYFELIPLKN